MAVLQSHTCENCGATLSFDPSNVSLTCEFCGSQYTSESAGEAIGFAADDTRLVPFNVELNEAQQVFLKWIGKGFFKPSDFEATFQQRGQTGVYIPFWSFTVEAHSDWQGQDGETRHRKVQKTRTREDGSVEHYTEDEPYTVWHNRQGDHRENYTDHIAASGGLTQDEADRLLPWDETAAAAYSEDYLVGWKAEPPGLTREQGWQRCQTRTRERERGACAKLVDKLTSVVTRITEQAAWLSLFPVWIFSYSYKAKQYRAVVNGQTGECHGTKPISAGKVALFVFLAIVAIAIIAGAIWFFTRSGGG